jgi:hypothetical protein
MSKAWLRLVVYLLVYTFEIILFCYETRIIVMDTTTRALEN